MSLDDKLLECIRYFHFRRGRLTYKYQVYLEKYMQ